MELQLKGYSPRTQKQLDHPDFFDLYKIEGQTQSSLNIKDLVLIFLSSPPAWVIWLMSLRNQIMAPFGYKTGAEKSHPTFTAESLVPGQEMGIFRVLGLDSQEVWLGQNDKHLDFILSIQLQDQGDHAVITVSTSVWFHNPLGKLYFGVIRRFHALVVQSMLKSLDHKVFKG